VINELDVTISVGMLCVW